MLFLILFLFLVICLVFFKKRIDYFKNISILYSIFFLDIYITEVKVETNSLRDITVEEILKAPTPKP